MSSSVLYQTNITPYTCISPLFTNYVVSITLFVSNTLLYQSTYLFLCLDQYVYVIQWNASTTFTIMNQTPTKQQKLLQQW